MGAVVLLGGEDLCQASVEALESACWRQLLTRHLPLAWADASAAVRSPAVGCLGSAATLSTAVFSLYQTRDGSAAIAGRCHRRLHTLRFVRMPSAPSPGDRPSWRRST